MLSVKDMTDYGFDYSACKRISDDDYETMLRNDCVPRINDVLVAKDGSYLKHIFVTKEQKDEAILSSIAIFRPNTDKINPQYLCYLLQNPMMKRVIKENYVSGSALPRIVLKDFKKIQIEVPALSEQKAIAATLSCLDDMIELNNRTNKVLEEITQAIFKRWFVDFEFPTEDGEPYKSSGGEMVESELGAIPKGWRVETLGDISKVVTKGTTPTTLNKQFVTKGINFVKAESITDNHYIDSEKFAFIDEETNQLLNRSKIEENDILFTMAGTIGRFALVKRDVLPANTNQAVAIIRIDASRAHPLFVYCGFLCELHSNYYFKRIQQAVQPNLSLSTIKSLPLVIPQKMVLNTFIKFITQLFNEMDNSQRLSMNLFKLRDTLLPKLMSGEIRVPIEEVV